MRIQSESGPKFIIEQNRFLKNPMKTSEYAMSVKSKNAEVKDHFTTITKQPGHVTVVTQMSDAKEHNRN